MNAPIIRVFGVIVVLFALLILWTSRWTVFESSKLNNNPLNARTLIDELRIKEGRILADDGTVLARSVPQPGHTWSRTYPTGDLFSQPIGYLIAAKEQSAGVERSDGSDLRGIQTGLSSVFGQLGGPDQVGDDVYTTLDPKAQRLAQQLLAGREGSVVALNPRTGAVKVMFADPTYDDNDPFGPCAQPSCQLNQSTQGSDPPGSTFKVVTATAAIDTGMFTPNSVLNGNSPKTISGVPLENDSNQSWGEISLTTALVNSVNTVWAQVAQDVGRATMTKYMQRFGFYSRPPLDYPPEELNISRPWTPTQPSHPYPPASPDEDIGRIGIGQGGLLVTPLQMAMVASAVADGGKLMVPHMTDRVVNSDGVTVKTIKPMLYNQVMKPSTAGEITQMMRKVVEEGTGTPANLEGVNIAGKTGTASIGATGSNLTEPWFIGFAPINDPKIAVAVTINQTYNGYGGAIAAPIAARVIQTLLQEGE